MAKIDVVMPQMGESIAEGTVTRWLKSVGEAVDRDEDLFEISTDKVDADIPSPATGVLVEVLVEGGETVDINTVVARIDTAAGAAAGGAASAPTSNDASSTPAAAPGSAAKAADRAAPQDTTRRAISRPPVEQQAQNGAPVTGAPATREERLRTRSTPLVRRIAQEHGIDISQVPGTGTAGRVTRDDIFAFIEAIEASDATPTTHDAAPAPAAPPPVSPPAAPGTLRVPVPGATLDIRLGPIPIREGDKVEEMSRVRLRTMEHMLMSKRVSAHVTAVIEVDFERVVQLRRKLKPSFANAGTKLTYGPFVYRAVVEALRAYPILNASVDGTSVVYHKDVNLGIAVAVNDGRELIVPVLKNADRLNLLGLAQGANDLAAKARAKNLGFDDIQGGTFTITNVGVFGNLFGTPIINQPQVAILGTGLIEKRPVVVQDALGNDVIAIRHRAYFGLSYDHRVVDGAMAAFFLNHLQKYLEEYNEEAG